MFFDLFSRSKLDAYAQTLASEIARRYPPAVANDPDQTISQKRLTAVLEEIFSGAQRFNRENRLGFFRRAVLGNTFQWMLRELGYDEKFIDTATKLLLVSLTRYPEAALEQAGKRGAVE
jgi:hypothetical protein